MANAMYSKGKEKILSAGINWVTDLLKAVLIKNTYAQNLVTDEFHSTISSYVLNSAKTITSPSVTAGVFDADNVTFQAVTAGDTVEAVVIYKDTTVSGTSPLLLYIDNITGFPLATNGGDITIQWDNGAFKIFSL